MTAANDLAVPAGAADLAERNRLLLGAVQESDAAEGNELSFDSKKDIAGCFLRLADMPTGFRRREPGALSEEFR
jgi:hypothetical protein